MTRSVVIIHTGAANTASVAAALGRLGLAPRISRSPREVRDADLVVLPGVGAFGPAMAVLRERGLDSAIIERCRESAPRPLLAICLGLQLLCASSDESPGVAGLAVVPEEAGGRVRRFAETVRVPQMGWNRVNPACAAESAETLVQPASMYFANSYRLVDAPPGWLAACSEHGGRFIAAIERGPLLACQFHPELSGRAGAELIARWVNRAVGRSSPPC